MNYKVGRNDPCPCSSGRKYKHCCGQPAALAEPPPNSHDGAIELAVKWLAQHHRKAFSAALTETMEEVVFDIFDDEQEAIDALASIEGDLLQQLQINLTEWLLAAGDMQVKGEYQEISELLLGPRGPILTQGQRAWLQQLTEQALRLYDITQVLPGVGVTVCDALDAEKPPLTVVERSGSQTLKVGMQIGARVMRVGEQHQFSGAIYPFSIFSSRSVLADLQEIEDEPGPHPEDDAYSASFTLIADWLAQYLLPPPMPDFIDSHTGEPVLLTTDHYAVQDWDALSTRLAAQVDVEGDRVAGWSRLLDCEDGQTRPQASINPEAQGTRVGVFYKTAGLAEKGRTWFDAVAGDSVKFQLREVSDPKGMLSGSSGQEARMPSSQTLPAGMTPEIMAEAIESAIKRSYANWADEPIPVLQNRTPREAMQDAAGLERVKGLLRSYEDGEADQSAQQGRRRISYQFLWDALGLQR